MQCCSDAAPYFFAIAIANEKKLQKILEYPEKYSIFVVVKGDNR